MLGEYANTTEIKLMTGVNMTEIKLNEIPKSKELMRSIKFADNYSKRSHVMSGFKFCIKNGSIKFSKFQVGNKTSVLIRGDKTCDSYQHTSYAYGNSAKSEHDIQSLYNLARNANESNESRISCAKSTDSNDILCLHAKNITDDILSHINRINGKFKRGVITNVDASDAIYTAINPDMIQINGKNREVIMSVIDGKTKYKGK